MSTAITPLAGDTTSAASPATREATRGASRGRKILIAAGPPFVVFLLFIGLWFLASHVLIHQEKRFLLPPPDQVIHDSLIDGFFRSEILHALWLTTRVSLVGFVLTIVVGGALGVAMSQAKWIERSLYPYAVLLQTLPIVAVIPAIGLTLGYNFNSRVFVSILLGLFPIITNTLFGLLSVERSMHDLFTLHKAGRWTRLVKLQLPAALPAIFTGLRIAAGLSVIGAVLGDMFFQQGDPGIGTLIVLYNTNLQLTTMYGAIIIASILGLAYFVLVGFAQQRVVGRWHESNRAGS